LHTLEQPDKPGTCFYTGKQANEVALFAKSIDLSLYDAGNKYGKIISTNTRISRKFSST
jgi:hypothetical protein